MVYIVVCNTHEALAHDDVIKWKHFPRYWPFARGIHRSPVNSPHKGQWRTALMFSLVCAWINVWANNREANDLRRHRAHYNVTVTNLRICDKTGLITARSITVWYSAFSISRGIIFPTNSEKIPHISPVRARCWVSFLSSYTEQSFSFLPLALCSVLCCIRPRYIENLMCCLQCSTCKVMI